MDFEPPEQPATGAATRPPMPPPPIPLATLEAPAPKRHGNRWIGIAAVAVVIAVAAVAVTTSGGGSKSPRAVLTAASARTTASGTARTTSTETITTGGRTLDLIDVDGVSDFEHKVSSLTLSSRGAVAMEQRFVGGTLYVSSPGADIPGGAHWIAIRPADLKLSADDSLLGSNDPKSGLQYLNTINSDPKIVDHEEIDSTDTTHYSFTVDLKSFFAKVSKSSEALGAPMGSVDQLEGIIDLRKLPAAAWIDGEGRVRKFVLTLAGSDGTESIKVVTTTRFSHFDEPVTVSAPDASDTVPLSQYPSFFTDLGSGGGALES